MQKSVSLTHEPASERVDVEELLQSALLVATGLLLQLLGYATVFYGLSTRQVVSCSCLLVRIVCSRVNFWGEDY